MQCYTAPLQTANKGCGRVTGFVTDMCEQCTTARFTILLRLLLRCLALAQGRISLACVCQRTFPEAAIAEKALCARQAPQ